MDTKELAVINYRDPEIVATLKATVAQGLSDPEFALFAQYCQSSGLNPFRREVWAIKAGGRLQIMTGVHGYWAIANSHPQFDGAEEEIEHDEKGMIVRAVCKIHRKDRKFPSVGTALMSEYRGSSPVWGKMPSVMLAKCAASVAIRKAFPQELAGTYTEEEMGAEQQAQVTAQAFQHQPQAIAQATYYSLATVDEGSRPRAEEYLKDHGATFDDALGVWVAPKKLDRLFSCIVAKPIEEAEIVEAKPEPEAPFIPADEDDIPTEWVKPAKETPLEKAKKRVAKMQEAQP